MAGVFLSLFLVLWLAPASAQETSAVDPRDLTADERQALLARLSDTEVRALVLEMLASDGSTPSGGETGLLGELTAVGEDVRSLVGSWAAQVSNLPEAGMALASSLAPPGAGVGRVLLVGLFIVLIIGGGLVAERLAHRLATPWWQRFAGGSTRFSSRLGHGLLRLLLRSLEVVVFVVVAAALFLLLWQGHEPTRVFTGYLVMGIAMTQFGVRLSDMLWSPDDASRRLVPVDDAAAAKIHRYIAWAVLLGAAQFIMVRYLRDIGVNPALVQLLAFSIGAVYVGLLNLWMWRMQQPLRAVIIDAERPSALRSLFASAWPLLYGLLTVLVYGVSLLAAATTRQAPAGAALSTLLIAAVLPFVLAAIRPLVNDFLDRREQRAVSMDERIVPRQGMRRPLIRVLGFLVVAGALALVSSLWGFNLVGFVHTGIGTAIGQAVLQIVAVVAVAWVIWAVARRAIDPHMAAESGGGEEMDEIGGAGVSRIATLLPLIRKTIFVVLVVMTTMVVLSALGVNIGPLLAGAGVVGIALGFGAQSLVTDIISGLFFLMDDAFRRGEYVEIGSTRGTVEKISIRSFQLRHHKGPLHTVPYGQIDSITNYSRDWAIMKFEIRVPFEVNVDRVRKLIKKVGQEMMEDPDVAEMLLAPLKSQGVNRMDDSAFIVRCKFTAKPGQQFVARRIAYTRIQEAFQREGIQFAPRRVIVETVSRDGGKGDEGAAGGAAALDAPGPQNG